MFHPEFRFRAPTGGDLLAEIGVDRHTVREVTEDERAIRCPERGAAYSEHGFANLSPEPDFPHALHEAAPAECWDPALSLPLAVRRWRRA